MPRLVGFTLAASAAALLLARALPVAQGLRPNAFEYLYHSQEPIAAWMSAALMLLAAAAAWLSGDPRAQVAALARRPHLFIAAVTAACAPF